jgi:hypothetical protein
VHAPGVRRAELFGDTLHVVVGSRERDWPAAAAAIVAGSVDVLDVREIEPSLEDVFIDRVASAEAARQ